MESTPLIFCVFHSKLGLQIQEKRQATFCVKEHEARQKVNFDMGKLTFFLHETHCASKMWVESSTFSMMTTKQLFNRSHH